MAKTMHRGPSVGPIVHDVFWQQARRLVVQDESTARSVTVHFEDGVGVHLREGFLPSYPKSIPFELVLVGMRVDLTVTPVGRVEVR